MESIETAGTLLLFDDEALLQRSGPPKNQYCQNSSIILSVLFQETAALGWKAAMQPKQKLLNRTPPEEYQALCSLL